MKRTLLISALLATVLSGCASTEDQATQAQVNSDPRMLDCNLATVEDRGPIRPSLYVVGTFAQSQWIHTEDRKMSHKGNGLYQLVREEKAGTINMQFATMSWNPQFTVSGKELATGQEKELKRGGFAKDTRVSIAEDGKYVWSIQLSEDKKPVSVVLAQCK